MAELSNTVRQLKRSSVYSLIRTKLCSQRVCVYVQLQQQQSRLMKINHDLRHKISVVEAQGKALIEQKVELEASAQARDQEVGVLRQEVARLRERLQGGLTPEEAPAQPPSPAEVDLPTCDGVGATTFVGLLSHVVGENMLH